MHTICNYWLSLHQTIAKTFWEHLLRAILETCDLWYICSEWWEDMTWPKKFTKTKDKDILRTPPRDLWHFRHWLQFWQLRIWIHDNLCCLAINCDTFAILAMFIDSCWETFAIIFMSQEILDWPIKTHSVIDWLLMNTVYIWADKQISAQFI